ncbi:virion structural protein [Pseudomonas phage 14Ps5-6]|nr:virion structural protein [Pseudomonas phage 14Ps5-6]
MFELLLSPDIGEELPLVGFNEIIKLGDLPVALAGTMSYVDGNTLYVGSGHHTEGQTAATVFRRFTISPFADIGATASGTFLPGVSLGFGTLHKNNFIVYGGITGWNSAGNGGTGTSNFIQHFDIATGNRVKRYSGPVPLWGTASASDGNDLILCVNPIGVNAMRLKPSSKSWLSGQDYSGGARSGQQLFFYNGYFYHFGGWDNTKNIPNLEVYRYNATTLIWEQTPWMIIPADKGTIWQGNGYVDGDYFNYLNAVDVGGVTKMFAQRFNIRRRKWAEPFELGIGFLNISSIAKGPDNSMIIVGGSKMPVGGGAYMLKSQLLSGIYQVKLAPLIID